MQETNNNSEFRSRLAIGAGLVAAAGAGILLAEYGPQIMQACDGLLCDFLYRASREIQQIYNTGF